MAKNDKNDKINDNSDKMTIVATIYDNNYKKLQNNDNNDKNDNSCNHK